ncbi:MAG: NAD-dependent epimerase/dehydratase family protein, partial [Anaerolineae bacterium]|nr:NAD-dependent epimerase/dehydratase family protein [Anaerolineae bacterium]
VNDRPKLWTLLQDVDVVYHLAARVSVPESVLYPREYNAANVGGTVSLMEAMRDVGVRRVVMASSGAVYGDLAAQPIKEDSPPNPRSPYAVSKLAAEHYIRTIGALWGMETVSLRIFNAYGPGQRMPVSHPPVVPHFIKQTLRNGTLVVHNDGKQTRDYVYVDDVVSALTAATTVPNLDGLVINVGSGTEKSVRDLVNTVTNVIPGKAEAIYNPRVSGGVSQMCADLTLAKKKLSYTPSVSLEEGLRLTLEKDSRFKVSS